MVKEKDYKHFSAYNGSDRKKYKHENTKGHYERPG